MPYTHEDIERARRELRDVQNELHELSATRRNQLLKHKNVSEFEAPIAEQRALLRTARNNLHEARTAPLALPAPDDESADED